MVISQEKQKQIFWLYHAPPPPLQLIMAHKSHMVWCSVVIKLFQY